MNLAPPATSGQSATPGTLQPTGNLLATPAKRCNDASPVESEALFQGQKMVEISHNGEIYRLQATRLGKLILTK